MATTPPRSESQESVDKLQQRLRLWGNEGEPQQDWFLLVADPSRLAEFCHLYESGILDSGAKFALMMLIVSSLDEALSAASSSSQDTGLLARIEGFLRQDFVLHLHTIHYWSLLDETDPTNVFPVTPLLRSIWTDCFKLEYQQWLEWD